MTNIEIRTHRIWTDPEINIRIYAQLCHLNFQDLLDKPLFERFYRHAECVMHKLHATRYHVERYADLEEEHYEHCLNQYRSGDTSTYESLDLIFELEAFLFQVKSSLDMLVKLLVPILDKRVRTHTFADKGDKLIAGLEQYKKDKSAPVEKVDDFIEMLRWSKQDWIERVIGIRDELNHVRGLTGYWFEPIKMPKGEILPVKPKFKGLDTLDFMLDTYGRNLVFHQDFACMALSLVAPRPFVLANQQPKHLAETYGELAACFKWSWGIALPGAGEPKP